MERGTTISDGEEHIDVTAESSRYGNNDILTSVVSKNNISQENTANITNNVNINVNTGANSIDSSSGNGYKGHDDKYNHEDMYEHSRDYMNDHAEKNKAKMHARIEKAKKDVFKNHDKKIEFDYPKLDHEDKDHYVKKDHNLSGYKDNHSKEYKKDYGKDHNLSYHDDEHDKPKMKYADSKNDNDHRYKDKYENDSKNYGDHSMQAKKKHKNDYEDNHDKHQKEHGDMNKHYKSHGGHDSKYSRKSYSYDYDKGSDYSHSKDHSYKKHTDNRKYSDKGKSYKTKSYKVVPAVKKVRYNNCDCFTEYMGHKYDQDMRSMKHKTASHHKPADNGEDCSRKNKIAYNKRDNKQSYYHRSFVWV